VKIIHNRINKIIAANIVFMLMYATFSAKPVL